MKITMRFYKRYDLDLIAAIYCCQLPLAKAIIKNSVVAFARGQEYKAEIPVIDVTSFVNNLGNKNNTLALQFYLDEKTEADVISWIKAIRNKQRNSFLRNVFRISISNMRQVMSAYHSNPVIVNDLLTTQEPTIQPTATNKFSDSQIPRQTISISREQGVKKENFKPKPNNIKLPKLEKNNISIAQNIVNPIVANNPVVAQPAATPPIIRNQPDGIVEPTSDATSEDDDAFFDMLSNLIN